MQKRVSETIPVNLERGKATNAAVQNSILPLPPTDCQRLNLHLTNEPDVSGWSTRGEVSNARRLDCVCLLPVPGSLARQIALADK